MSTLINSRYQYDPTGQNPSNLIVDEPQTIPQLGARLVVAREGLFYTHDYSLRPATGGAPLILNVDYHYVSIDAYLTAETGIETGTAIEIDNSAVYGDYLLTYHAVGGVEGNSNALVQDLIKAIELASTGAVDWTKILNTPTQFPPNDHLHAVTSLTELEVVSQSISGLERALLDSRPLQSSAQQLIWQDERIMSIIANLSNTVNRISLDVQVLKEDLLKAHQIRWADGVTGDLGIFNKYDAVNIAIPATSNLGDEFISYDITDGDIPYFLNYDSGVSELRGEAPGSNYSENFTFRLQANDKYNAVAQYFILKLVGAYNGLFDKSDVVDCGWINEPPIASSTSILIDGIVDCTQLTGLNYNPVNWDVTDLGYTTGPAPVGVSDTLYLVDINCGIINDGEYINYNTTIVDCLSIDEIAIAGPGQYLEVDTVDAGVIASPLDYTDLDTTIVDCLMIGSVPTAGPGQYLEVNTVDAGVIVSTVNYTELYTTIVDCLSIDEVGIAGPGQYLESDMIDVGIITSPTDYIERQATIIDCLSIDELAIPTAIQYLEPDAIDCGALI